MAKAFQYSDAEVDDLKHLIDMVNKGDVRPDSFLPKVYADMRRVSDAFNVPITPPASSLAPRLEDNPSVPVSTFEGMDNEQLEQIQTQTAMANNLADAEASEAEGVITASEPTVITASEPRTRQAPKKSTSRSTGSTRSTSRQSPASSAFSSLEDYDKYLQGQLEKARRDLNAANLELHRVDTEGDRFPGESQDLQLMRALSDQIRNEGGQSYSNIAAQLAMVQDANFGPVFDRAVNKRVNAARKFFGRAGQIQRAAQAEKAAYNQYRQRVRSRSDARVKSLAKTIEQLEKARFDIMKAQYSEAGKNRRAATLAAGKNTGIRGSIEIPRRITALQRQKSQLNQLIDKSNDPKAAVTKGTFRKIAKQLTGKDFDNDQNAIKGARTQIQRIDQELNNLLGIYGAGAGANRLPGILADVEDIGAAQTGADPGSDAFNDMFGSKKN